LSEISSDNNSEESEEK
jgi:hypothetical protein